MVTAKVWMRTAARSGTGCGWRPAWRQAAAPKTRLARIETPPITMPCSEWPITSSPYMSPAQARLVSRKPVQSKAGRVSERSLGISQNERPSATMPIGTFRMKIQCQEA